MIDFTSCEHQILRSQAWTILSTRQKPEGFGGVTLWVLIIGREVFQA